MSQYCMRYIYTKKMHHLSEVQMSAHLHFWLLNSVTLDQHHGRPRVASSWQGLHFPGCQAGWPVRGGTGSDYRVGGRSQGVSGPLSGSSCLPSWAPVSALPHCRDPVPQRCMSWPLSPKVSSVKDALPITEVTRYSFGVWLPFGTVLSRSIMSHLFFCGWVVFCCLNLSLNANWFAFQFESITSRAMENICVFVFVYIHVFISLG